MSWKSFLRSYVYTEIFAFNSVNGKRGFEERMLTFFFKNYLLNSMQHWRKGHSFSYSRICNFLWNRIFDAFIERTETSYSSLRREST